MTTQEEARKAMAKARQHEEHIQENLLQRSQETIEEAADRDIEAEARELMTQERQEDKHIKETMLSRSEAEISNTEA